MINADKFIEKIIEEALKGSIQDRRGYAFILLDGFGVNKATEYLKKNGYSLLHEGGNSYRIVPGKVKETTI